MREFKISDFVSEKMKIIPISDEDFEKISDTLTDVMIGKKDLRVGDVALIDNRFFRFISYKQFEKFIVNGIFGDNRFKLPTDDFLKDGVFVCKCKSDTSPLWIGLGSYMDGLVIPGFGTYDIQEVWRPDNVPDLSNPNSYIITECGKGYKLLCRRSDIVGESVANDGFAMFEKMKIIPISDDDFVKISSSLTPKECLKTGDVVRMRNGLMYRFVKYDDFNRNRMWGMVYPSIDKEKDKDKYDWVFMNIKDGGFFNYGGTYSGQFGYMGMLNYDDNLVCGRGTGSESNYTIDAIYRPNKVPDLTDKKSYKNLDTSGYRIVWEREKQSK